MPLIYRPHTRYILSFVVEKINCSNVTNIAEPGHKTNHINPCATSKHHRWSYPIVIPQSSWASRIKVNCTQFADDVNFLYTSYSLKNIK